MRSAQNQQLHLLELGIAAPSQRPLAAKDLAWRTQRPWEAVVLGVDPGKHAGWSLWIRGRYYMSGEVVSTRPGACDDIIVLTVETAKQLKLPCALHYEWSAWGPSAATTAGLAASMERWLVQWRTYARGNLQRREKVDLSRWRSRILGKGYGSGNTELNVAAREQLVATALIRAYALDNEHRNDATALLGANQAPAICIGFYGSYSVRLGRKLPKATQAMMPAGGL